MKNQAYRMTMLYDFYGDLLTERQKEFYDLYYNEDLSLAEIAENYGITRQGVRDIIARAEGSLLEVEEKTGLIRKYHNIQNTVTELQSTLDEVRLLNDAKLQNVTLEELCIRMKGAIDTLRGD